MIEKEEWMSRHKNDEKARKAFKSGKRNGQEVIFAPACGLKEDYS